VKKKTGERGRVSEKKPEKKHHTSTGGGPRFQNEKHPLRWIRIPTPHWANAVVSFFI